VGTHAQVFAKKLDIKDDSFIRRAVRDSLIPKVGRVDRPLISARITFARPLAVGWSEGGHHCSAAEQLHLFVRLARARPGRATTTMIRFSAFQVAAHRRVGTDDDLDAEGARVRIPYATVGSHANYRRARSTSKRTKRSSLRESAAIISTSFRRARFDSASRARLLRTRQTVEGARFAPQPQTSAKPICVHPLLQLWGARTSLRLAARCNSDGARE
jgi:hypothetical protein